MNHKNPSDKLYKIFFLIDSEQKGKNGKMCGKNEPLFVNKITLNEHTLREISLGLWSYRKGKNKIPMILFLLALLCPAVYALITKTKDVLLLIVPILVIGLICIFGYAGYSAYKGSKSREKMIVKIMEEYGNAAELSISFAGQINYTVCGKEKTVSYSDIKNIIELDMYLVLVLENNVELPIWKVGFTHGNWDAFIPYLKKMSNQ